MLNLVLFRHMCAKRDSETTFSRKIVSLLNKKRIIETNSLQEFLDGRSRRSVFRDLSGIQYLSSMTHAGKYITLPHIPQFDANGLWFFRDIGFSVNGTIQGAIHRVVIESDAGRTHEELKEIFRVRIHNALIALIKGGRLTRELFGEAERFLYLSGDTLRSRKQLEKRKLISQSMATLAIEQTLSSLVVIQILVEIIRSGENHVSTSDVYRRLKNMNGGEITPQQVEFVFTRYEIGIKKTPRSG